MGLNKSGWRTYHSQIKSDFQKQQEDIAQENFKQQYQEKAHFEGRSCFYKDCTICYPN